MGAVNVKIPLWGERERSFGAVQEKENSQAALLQKREGRFFTSPALPPPIMQKLSSSPPHLNGWDLNVAGLVAPFHFYGENESMLICD